MVAYLLRIHRILLPEKEDSGWFPYFWLIYLAGYLIQVSGSSDPAARWLAYATVVVFLYLYFRGFWIKGPRILWLMGAISAIAIIMMPYYSSAFVFYIYAASFAGQLPSPRTGFISLFPIVIMLALSVYLLGLHRAVFLSGGSFTLLVGVINIYASHLSRKNAQLKLSQEEVRHLAAMTERERISRDLHDLLGHTLSVITLKAELAAKLLDRDKEKARVEIADVEQISRQALKQVREAVLGYRTTGLQGELANARLAFEASGIRFRYNKPSSRIGAQQEAVLAMVIREAVTNVIRHAHATRCTIHFEQTDNGLEVFVRDDGRADTIVEGNGIQGMRERLNGIGASLKHHTEQGFSLSIHLPRQHMGEGSRYDKGGAC